MYLGLDLTTPERRFNSIWQMVGGRGVPFPAPTPSAAPPTAIAAQPLPIIVSRPVSRPAPTAPIRIVNEGGPGPIPIPVVAPTITPPPAAVPSPVPVAANAGTPVPAGFPTNQIFVAPDGSFWEFGSNGWVNVGIPYGTGASATPPAPAPSPTGGSSAPPAGTVAPAPVNLNVAAPPAAGYQEILDWLGQDTLLSTIGFSGVPNWIVSFGAAIILYKVAQKKGR
jgi:hypothetical protein